MLPPSIQDELERIAQEHGLGTDVVSDLRLTLTRLASFIPALEEPAGQTWTVREVANEETTLEIWLQPRHFNPMEEPVPGPHRFEEMAPLGQGGAAQVLRVWDPSLQRAVALKALHPELLSDPAAVASFIREAQLTAQLQHPGIIPVYEQGRLPDGRLYFTMKEVRGRTLKDMLREVHAEPEGEFARSWPLRRRVEVFLAVCEALAYAHAQSVVHLDLKPANLMLGPFSELQVVDWGLAARFGELGRGVDAGGRGSPAYMPPEQVQADLRPSPSADVYSLGAVLYELLCGHAPYGGRSPEQALSDLVAGPPPPPSAMTQLPVPRELESICLWAMDRDPGKRPRDAAVLGQAVRAWLDGSLRREQALAQLRSAEVVFEESRAMGLRAAQLRREASRLLTAVPSWAPEERRWEGWALEDEAEGLEHDAALAMQRGAQGLIEAIGLDPDLAEAHQRLAQYYCERHTQAETRRDLREAARLEMLIRAHDRGRLGAYLKGDGALTLITQPEGAEVWLERYELRGRRLVPVPQGLLGHTPLREHPLAMGSYRLRLKAPGHHEVLYPVHINRLEHWHGVPPDRSAPQPVALPPLGSLAPDEVYVPGGWFVSGGDQNAADSSPRRLLWADAFVIQRNPVTLREYMRFLNALLASGREQEALACAPRQRPGLEGGAGQLLVGRDAEGRFQLDVDGEGDRWLPDWPAFYMDWFNADSYARWRSEETGQPWRLPFELEWEKAARGVDGRFFPWGDRSEPIWSLNRASHSGRPLPCEVSERPVDESPYGLRHMSGNTSDWMIDPWVEAGPLTISARVQQAPPDPNHEGMRSVRGGNWMSTPRASRLARRERDNPDNRIATRGLRILRLFSA